MSNRQAERIKALEKKVEELQSALLTLALRIPPITVTMPLQPPPSPPPSPPWSPLSQPYIGDVSVYPTVTTDGFTTVLNRDTSRDISNK